MKLSSVRDLKAELLSVPAAVAADLAESAPFSAFSARRATARRTMDGIALGVSSFKKGYRLAVRLQRTGPLVSAMTEEIRKRAKGEVDVGQIGTIVKYQSQTSASYYRKRRRPLRIGSSIGDKPPAGFAAAGTLGCFVSRRSSPYYLAILTNNHVIAAENDYPIGDPIVQPGTLDGGSFSSDVIGELGKTEKLHTGTTNYVDAAVAYLYEGVDFDARKIGNLGNLSGSVDVANLPADATVHKVGRTTGQTKGRVTAFDVDNVRVEYDLGVLRFDDQIEIEGAGTKAFSDSGDSGSLIVDSKRRAVGLLFAGGDVGGSNGKGLTYANPIGTVLDELGVDLEV